MTAVTSSSAAVAEEAARGLDRWKEAGMDCCEWVVIKALEFVFNMASSVTATTIK